MSASITLRRSINGHWMNWINCGCVEQRPVVLAAIHAVAKTYAKRIADGLEHNFAAQAATVFLRHSPISIRTQLADCSSTPVEGTTIALPVRKGKVSNYGRFRQFRFYAH